MAKNTAKQCRYSGLKPYRPGQSGNPKGRPRLGISVAERIRELGDQKGFENMIKAMFTKAGKGDVQAAKLLWDRAYGQAPQTVELGTTAPTLIQWQERARDWFLKNDASRLMAFCEWMDGAGTVD